LRANRHETADRYAYPPAGSLKTFRINPHPFDIVRELSFFSAASIWEIVIKLGLGREDFKVDPYRLRKMLVVHGYAEMFVTAEHALKDDSLQLLHIEPFDRLLIAQARAEGMALVTGDTAVSQYQESVLAV
jgi:PIN domain nuclease of toxin-antitoxin system